MLQHRTGRAHLGAGLSLALALLAGCEQREAEPPTAPSSEAEAPAGVASEAEQQGALERGEIHEAAPMFDGAYAPMSKTAESITDEIAFENDTIQFGFGHTYETTAESMIRQDDATGMGFTEVLTVPAGTYIEIRKVTSELVNPRAENGGLCKPEAARWLVFAAVRDADDTTKQVAMAAYKGAAAPTPATAERDLCGTFTYVRTSE
jgi:hypothetical protein